jgi:hypothetical protein
VTLPPAASRFPLLRCARRWLRCRSTRPSWAGRKWTLSNCAASSRRRRRRRRRLRPRPPPRRHHRCLRPASSSHLKKPRLGGRRVHQAPLAPSPKRRSSTGRTITRSSSLTRVTILSAPSLPPPPPRSPPSPPDYHYSVRVHALERVPSPLCWVGERFGTVRAAAAASGLKHRSRVLVSMQLATGPVFRLLRCER